MTRATVAPERATIELDGWETPEARVGPGLGAIAAAHNAGVIDLPGQLVAAINARTEAERQRVAAARRMRAAQKAAPERPGPFAKHGIARPVLTAENRHLFSRTAKEIKAANEAAERAISEHDVARRAAGRAGDAVRSGVIAHADELTAALVEALDEVLELGRDDAPAIQAVRFSDPASVARLGPDGQAAWQRLEELAERHDVIRRAGVGLLRELEAARAVGEFPRGTFVGYGAVAPMKELKRGPLASSYDARGWGWQPIGHPVQRLAAAVQAA